MSGWFVEVWAGQRDPLGRVHSQHKAGDSHHPWGLQSKRRGQRYHRELQLERWAVPQELGPLDTAAARWPQSRCHGRAVGKMPCLTLQAPVGAPGDQTQESQSKGESLKCSWWGPECRGLSGKVNGLERGWIHGE